MVNIFRYIFLLISLLLSEMLYTQNVFGNYGLITMPTSGINNDGVVMFGGNFLPPGIINTENHSYKNWNYNSWNYYLSATFLSFWDFGIRFTTVKSDEFKKVNQDRSLYTKFLIIKDSLMYSFMPSVALGIEDIYLKSFNNNNNHMKIYVAIGKDIKSSIGQLSINMNYMYRLNSLSKRKHFLQIGTFYTPIIAKNIKLMAEYDGLNINLGVRYQLFKHLHLTAGYFHFKSFTGGIACTFKIY